MGGNIVNRIKYISQKIGDKIGSNNIYLNIYGNL